MTQSTGFGAYPNSDASKLFEGIILFLLGIYLFIDTLNGVAVNVLSLPNILSAGYKLGLLGLMLIYALRYQKTPFMLSIGILAFIFIWAILRFIFVDQLAFMYAFQEAIKLAYLFIMVSVLSTMRSLSENKFRYITYFAIVILLLNILSTFLGFGFSTYGDFGAKGFFYAGNAVSGIIIICACYFLVVSYRKSIILFLLISLLLMLISIVVGTKSGLIGVMIATALTMLIYADARSVLLFFVGLVLLAVSAFAFLDVITDHPLYHRFIFFYEQGGLALAIFSGREQKLAVVMPLIFNGEIVPLLFGANINDLEKIGVTRVEFDWFDMQINFGLVLSAVAYFGHIMLFTYLLTLPKNRVVVSAIMATAILYFISILAGHVLYNGMVTPMWALIIATAIRTTAYEKKKTAEISGTYISKPLAFT